MNLSAISDHRWYSSLASQFIVLLDGVKPANVVTASGDEGWIEQYEGKEIVRRSGVVELLMLPNMGRFITPNFLRVAEWLTNAGKEVGNLEHLSVQAGCMLEEVGEFIEQLEISESYSDMLESLQALAREFKGRTANVSFLDPLAALDALCDIDVTINGVAFLAGWNKLKADMLVLEANDNKFVDGKPVILPGGKIGKRPGWQPADLSECLKSAASPG